MKQQRPRDAKKERVVDLSASNDIRELLEQRESYKDLIARYGKHVEEVEAELRAKIGDAERALVPGWNVTYANTHREGYSVPARTGRALRIRRLNDQRASDGEVD